MSSWLQFLDDGFVTDDRMSSQQRHAGRLAIADRMNSQRERLDGMNGLVSPSSAGFGKMTK